MLNQLSHRSAVLSGPLFVKLSLEGKFKSAKCTFVCSPVEVQEPSIEPSTSIELTPSLTTQVFIHCLRRFVAHRGIPELIISDNAKTFKAAATQLARIFSDPGVMSFLLKRKIQLKFNLEKAPWWVFFFNG